MMARITRTSKRVWIGEVGVSVSGEAKTLSPGVKGAYVSALAYSETEAEYRTLTEDVLATMGLIPFEFSDVEPLEIRRRNYKVSAEILELAAEVETTKEVRFGSFYTFSNVE